MRPLSLLISIFVFSLTTLFLFTCTTAPTKGPNDRSNTTITIVGKSSKNITSSDMVDDSVGNAISIGVYSNFPNYLDSVQLKLVIPDLKDSLLKTFYKLTSLNNTDTSWHFLSFGDSGTKKVYGKAYINDYNKPASDTLRVIIHGKPVNYKPSIAIAGLTTISIGQQCNLAITANDTDKTQTVTLNILRVPSGAVFNAAGTFIWTPPKGFIGNDSAIFVAKDNGYPVMYDTAVVIITVLGSSINHAPAWQKKTINEVGQPGVAISITLSDKCTDPDGDTLTFLLLSGSLDGDSIVDDAGTPTYSLAPGQADTGVFYPRIVAKDPQGLADTLTIALRIRAPTIDSLPPSIKLVYPASDNASVSSSAIAVKIQCVDPSGVAGVRCSIGADTFPMTHSDSIYTASVSGLKQGVIDTIAFIAVDASSRANTDTFFVHIKYDSSMIDAEGPTITKVSSTITGGRTANPNDTLVYTVTDPSGVDTVSWTLNGVASGVLTAAANGQYSIKAVLTKSHTNKIVIIASDKSPNHNKSSDTMIVDYNRPPVISGAHDTTIQELSTVQFTVSAKDPDSDNVTLSASGLPTGATFVPATGVFKWVTTAGQNGTFPVTFKANDGLDTATKSINIVISNMPPPTITKNPVADTVCLGGSASFVVVATGTGLTYQWKNAPGNLTGAHYKGITKDTLTIDTVKAGDAATYTCVVTNAAGSVASSTGAKLTVNIPSTAPTLAANNASVCSGGSVTFTMTGGTLGTGANWAVYAGASKLTTQPTIANNSFTISNITAAASYSVKTENGSCDNAGSPPNSNSVAITMNQSSTTPTLAANITSVCPPGTVIFTITGTLGTGANWAVYAGGTKLSTQPTISNNSFTISNISAATTYSVKAEGGTCDNAGSPPTSNNVTISISTYNVTFNSNGGTPVPSVQTIPCNGTASAPTTAQTPSKTGYNLVGWYLDTSSSSAYNFSTPITGAITLNAKWAIKQYTLAYNIIADVSGVTGQITASPSQAMYDSNSTVTLTAPTDNNYTFTGWIGDKTGSSNQISIVMNANKTLHANYAIKKWTLNITVNPSSAAGSVAATPSTDPYNNGTSVSLTATANNGYKFTNWGGDAGSGTNPQVSVTMNANKSVTATFAQLFTVTYSGTGAPVDNNKYQTGDSVTVLGAGSLVNSGFTLWGWTLNGVMYKIGAKFKMGSSNVTLLPSWVVMDREGNIYDTVTINGTIWLKQNLKTRSITLGNPILCRSASAWAANSSTPKCCFYGFLDNDNYGVGAFYNAAAITSMSNLAPDGWHIATVNDFDNLMPSGDAKSIAVPGTDYWLHDYGTNSTGFSAVGSGYCDSTGFFNGYQQETFFWASSGVDAAELYIYKEVTFLMNRFQMTNIGLGYSVRCVKNP